ncbi:hypothetical protein D3C78_1507800 [compost metagenome]
MKRWRKLLVDKRQDRLEQPCNAGGMVEMANICFQRADGAKLPFIGISPEGARQPVDFDRVAQ